MNTKMQTLFADLWKIIILSLSSPLKEKSIPRTFAIKKNYKLTHESLNTLKKSSDDKYTDEYIDFPKKQVDVLRTEVGKKDNINLSVTYQCILFFCCFLIIISIIGLLVSSFMYKDPLTYSQQKFVDICFNLLTSLSGAFVGLLGGKAIK